MLGTVGPGQPVTLAGDAAQAIIAESGFTGWDDLLRDIGAEQAEVQTLQTAYRSTHEVMQLAREVLGPLSSDIGEARRHGAPVELHRFSDPGQAVDFLGSALRDLMRRESGANVAVVARYLDQAQMYYQGLKKAEVPFTRLVAAEDFAFKPGVAVTDVRQVKGLEFDYVVMVEANADSYGTHDHARHAMHVGITRAAHQLWLVSTGTPSPLLPARLTGAAG